MSRTRYFSPCWPGPGPAMQRLPLEFDLPDALWAYILAAPDRSTAPSPPSSFALDHAPSIRSILRASGTCRSSRRALQFIERAAVESAAEGNARALSLFPAAKRIDVRFVAAHSAQEQAEAALEAGIGEGAQGGEANQQAATEASRQHADMRGDAEELAQRLPFALCVIPNLSNVHTDYAGCQDVTPQANTGAREGGGRRAARHRGAAPSQQARAVFKTFLLGVCNARSAGQLRSLLYLEHGARNFSRPSAGSLSSPRRDVHVRPDPSQARNVMSMSPTAAASAAAAAAAAPVRCHRLTRLLPPTLTPVPRFSAEGYLSCRSSTCGHASCDGNFCARLLRDAPVRVPWRRTHRLVAHVATPLARVTPP